MNDFDKFLELQLRAMLDPVVATPPPPRKSRRPKPRRLILAVEAPIELAPEAIPVETVAVTVSGATTQL